MIGNESAVQRVTFDWLRPAFGAALGIILTAWICRWWLGANASLPSLIAPIGASSVLLFAVPASPLAQPRAFVGGNFVSAVVGVLVAHSISSPVLGAACAVGGAIIAMIALRCLHPPSGAVALTAVIGGPHITALGYWFVLTPVLLNSMIMLAVAMIYNRLVGLSYPHRAHSVMHPMLTHPRILLTLSDYADVIEDYGEPLTVGADDLEKLFEELSARNARANFGYSRA